MPGGRLLGHDDTSENCGARGQGLGGRSANIFANAASALSPSAEEIPIDDIGPTAEVERLTGAAVVQRMPPEHDVAPLVDGLPAIPGRDREVDRERSLSPLRAQVSLHDRQGFAATGEDADGVHSPELVRRRSASGESGEHSMAGERVAFAPPVRPRTSAGVRPLPLQVPAEVTCAGEADTIGMDAADDQCVEQAAAPDAESAPGASHPASPAIAERVPSRKFRAEASEAAPPGDGDDGSHCEDTSPCGQEATAEGVSAQSLQGSWLRGRAVQAPSSVSSSDLSSFAGFIEDPLEQERSGDIQAWRIGLAGDTEEVKPDRSAF
eukprot:CAMPEP_0176291620 /NCGR_PEP_ID=MMETSP0121_2-20121125/55642_1 /TAXON_ID=160619 /ORGANISM="Kryptoperidinium foliaceum, Strain CCMP 1326" /LENGTH=322 /DNA_ID=CAMNT_0017632467 /DNA_START=44 /DNA_END=1009 /DNA_ORIENTATION=+